MQRLRRLSEVVDLGGVQHGDLGQTKKTCFEDGKGDGWH